MEVPVICRLSRSLLVTAASFGFLALLVLWVGLSSPETTILEALAVTSLFGIPAFFIILAYCCCRITANENGLEIRHMFKTEFIEWRQISDFYFLLPSSSKQSRKPNIFIEYGTRQHLISHDLENLPALLEVIELKATQANAQKFNFKEMRSVLDTPQVFEYAAHQIWPLVLAAFISWLVCIGMLFVPIIAEKGWSNYYDSTFGVLPPPLNWLLVVMTLAFTGIIPAIFLSGIPVIKTVHKFHGQQITASQDGIEWRNGSDKIEILWSEIKRYHLERIEGNFQGQLLVVESEDKRLCFTRSISRSRLLRQLIQQLASNAETEQWEFAAGHHEDTLGRSAVIGEDGKQIFHYQTRMNRLFLWGGIAFSCCLFLIGFVPPKDLSASVIFLAMALSIGIVAIYSGLAYYGSRVEITPKGMLHVTPFRKVFMRWDEVQALKSKNAFLIIGENRSIRLSWCLSEGTHFMKTVTQYSGQQWEISSEQTQSITNN